MHERHQARSGCESAIYGPCLGRGGLQVLRFVHAGLETICGEAR